MPYCGPTSSKRKGMLALLRGVLAKSVIIFFAAFVVLLAVQSLMIAIMPRLVSKFVLQIIRLPELQVLTTILIYLALIQVLLSLLTAFASILALYLSSEVQFKLRVSFFTKLSGLPIDYFRSEEIGEIESHFSNDLENINQFLVQDLPGIIVAGLSSLVILTITFFYSIALGEMFLSTFALILLLVILLNKAQLEFSNRMRIQFSLLSQIFLETVRGIDVLKAYVSEPMQIEKFSREAETFRLTARQSAVGQTLRSSPINFLLSFYSLGVMGFGGYMVLRHALSPDTFLVCLLYGGNLQSFISQLLSTGYTLHSVHVAFDRLSQFLEQDTENFGVHPGTSPEVAGQVPGSGIPISKPAVVSFDRVTFNYADGPTIFRDLSFEAAPGNSLALIGRSGSGKTTLLNLLLRFCEPTSGRITINGRDISSYSLSELRGSIAYLDQQALIFQGTIRENIVLSNPEATDELVMSAAREAGIEEMIMNLPKGLETQAGAQGLMLSGGQRQRICLARALLKNSCIMVFDEPTASLDSETARSIYATLQRLMRSKTIILVTHQKEVSSLAANIINMEGFNGE